RRARGERMHPRDRRRLARGAVAVQLHRLGAVAGGGVGLWRAVPAPIIRPACCSRLRATGGDLLVVALQLAFVGPLDGAHAALVASIAWAAACSTHCRTHACICAACRLAFRRPERRAAMLLITATSPSRCLPCCVSSSCRKYAEPKRASR